MMHLWQYELLVNLEKYLAADLTLTLPTQKLLSAGDFKVRSSAWSDEVGILFIFFCI